ncbi:hypothetical protein [Bartonella sp. HY761]|uniref:hypothetical protein n=1 Tax=Bartonella sp. HY761 TaxID=2979330 RepID=UPI0022007539|nr:hypothetical protein [Bartonella sp. HY761]UXN07279.1 hypothetical protein N6A79_04545 [Bartonella sp. HY761]
MKKILGLLVTFFVAHYCLIGWLSAQNLVEAGARDTPSSYSYFDKAPRSVFTLAEKIERKQDITLAEVKALPEGALNARYDAEITLLFFAARHYNLQAIDILLQAGADPYMVDRPSQKSVHDFTFYITDMNTPGSYEDTMKFRTELMRIYLKNGGDPNHELPSTSKTHLLVSAILMRNIKGARMLIEAGADRLKMEGTGLSGPTMLAIRRDDESNQLLKDIICNGAYDHATEEQIRKIITYLKPLGATDLEREENQRKLAMFILKRHPNFKDNVSTKYIFNGPIPWKTIGKTSDEVLCK